MNNPLFFSLGSNERSKREVERLCRWCGLLQTFDNPFNGKGDKLAEGGSERSEATGGTRKIRPCRHVVGLEQRNDQARWGGASVGVLRSFRRGKPDHMPQRWRFFL